jgi:hypothetical protein
VGETRRPFRRFGVDSEIVVERVSAGEPVSGLALVDCGCVAGAPASGRNVTSSRLGAGEGVNPLQALTGRRVSGRLRGRVKDCARSGSRPEGALSWRPDSSN